MHLDLETDPPVVAVVVVDRDHQVGGRRALHTPGLDIDAAAARGRLGDLRKVQCNFSKYCTCESDRLCL